MDGLSEIRYMAQVYVSEESKQTPHATTPDEAVWGPAPMPGRLSTLADAITRAKQYAQEGLARYKTSRVLEVNPDDMTPIAAVWMSQWERPIMLEEAGAARGIPGETIKMHVWMHRGFGPPDHWGWARLRKLMDHNANSWDLAYGREIDRSGRYVLWSIRLNIYAPSGTEPIIDWDWWKILGYDRKKDTDKVELIRAHEIEPRTIPSGVETVHCTNCAKTIPKADAWGTYNNETDEYDRPFCSCFCIDEFFGGLCEPGDPGGIYEWRVDRNGEFVNESDEGDAVHCEWKLAQYSIA